MRHWTLPARHRVVAAPCALCRRGLRQPGEDALERVLSTLQFSAELWVFGPRDLALEVGEIGREHVPDEREILCAQLELRHGLSLSSPRLDSGAYTREPLRGPGQESPRRPQPAASQPRRLSIVTILFSSACRDIAAIRGAAQSQYAGAAKTTHAESAAKNVATPTGRSQRCILVIRSPRA